MQILVIIFNWGSVGSLKDVNLDGKLLIKASVRIVSKDHEELHFAWSRKSFLYFFYEYLLLDEKLFHSKEVVFFSISENQEPRGLLKERELI